MDIVYNWHITETCNYSCIYCFAKWDHGKEIWKCKESVFDILSGMKNSYNTSFFEKIKKTGENSKVRVNFAGGEPLILGRSLIKIIKKRNKSCVKTQLCSSWA